MNIKTLPVGLIDTNCYFVHLPEKRLLYVIDPGGDAAEIVAVARSFDFDSVEILLTHTHVDYISAAGEVAKALGFDCVRLAAADHPLYASPENALLPWLPAAKNLPPAKEFAPNDDFTVIPLPVLFFRVKVRLEPDTEAVRSWSFRISTVFSPSAALTAAWRES